MSRFLNKTFLALLLGGILIAHVLATYFHWYWYVWWFDIPMHLIGGFFVGALVIWSVEQYRKDVFANLSFLEQLIIVLGLAALVGVFWEFFEFFLDVFWVQSRLPLYMSQLGATDTVKDLANDLIGAILAFLIVKKS